MFKVHKLSFMVLIIILFAKKIEETKHEMSIVS